MIPGDLHLFFTVVRSHDDEVIVLCPFCVARGRRSPDSDGKLGLNFTKNVGGCVRCGWGTKNLRRFLKSVGCHSSIDLKQSVADLKQQVLGKINTQGPEFKVQTATYSGKCIPIQFAPKDYSDSLERKGVPLEMQKRWGIRAMVDGPHEGYAVFPFTEFGELCYWQGRAVWPHLPRKYSPPLPLGSACWVYNYPDKREDVFGKILGITEGTLDCISVMESCVGTEHEGKFWAVSIQGTSMSKQSRDRHRLNSQLGKIISLKPSEVLVILDPEERDKSKEILQSLLEVGLNARRVKYPHGTDPNKLFQHNPKKLYSYLFDE